MRGYPLLGRKPMKAVEPTKIKDFQHMIFSWWKENRRDLPWRKTQNPYHIHVSEVMLQQTQVSRVLPKYVEFLDIFPTVQSLSAASTGDVIIAWKGMGYNRRALYLKRTAEIVVSSYDGMYPQKEQKLLNLPGLGKYTARAILVFAYNQQLAFVDTNIRQIIEHYFFSGAKQHPRDIQAMADQLLPKGKAWDWHQALMDYGALELSKNIKKSDFRNTVIPDMIRNPIRKSTQSKLPFQDTNRFIRGRIMDTIRVEYLKKEELINRIEDTYSKPKERIIYNLNNLIKEGLLEQEDNFIRLPK